MNNRNFIIGGVVAVLAILAIGLFVLQRNGAESVVRRTIMSNQEHSAEIATNLQRTDRITTVLCGVASPIATDGAQTCTAVFVNGQFLLFDIHHTECIELQEPLAGFLDIVGIIGFAGREVGHILQKRGTDAIGSRHRHRAVCHFWARH